ncbi:MAG TPA: agmatinase [Rhodospirillales bacterium]|nr:agmatinase [Rhodospirillales bacterium]
MRPPPTFAIAPTFLGVGPSGNGIAVAGIPLDIGTTNRSGSRFGPQAIRHASRMLVDGDHPVHWVRPSRSGLADVGDFAIAMGDLDASLAMIESQALGHDHLVALGGDHSVSLPLLRALARRRGGSVGLIHFDAHVDTWPDSFGLRYGHGSVFYHAICEGLVDPRRMVQIGIRSPTERDVYEWTRAQGVRIVTAAEVHETGPAAVAEVARSVVGTGATYVSFDIDGLDPAFAPGTGTPEVGGLSTWQAQAIIRRLGGICWAGMDLVEVAPAYDVSEITALAGATMVWEYLSLVAAGTPASGEDQDAAASVRGKAAPVQ